jgi:hypothetical protein
LRHGPGQVHETVLARPRDVRRAADPVDLRWVNVRRKCGNCECLRKTFTEWVPQLPPRCRITARLREQATGDVRRRVVRARYGRRGRAGDPEYGIKGLLARKPGAPIARSVRQDHGHPGP